MVRRTKETIEEELKAAYQHTVSLTKDLALAQKEIDLLKTYSLNRSVHTLIIAAEKATDAMTHIITTILQRRP